MRLQVDTIGRSAAPRLAVEVWQLDELDRVDLCGYGFAQIPLVNGFHKLEICCWRPAMGGWHTYLHSKFIGGYPRLIKPEEIVSSNGNRWGLRTETTGAVHATISVFILDVRPIEKPPTEDEITQQEILARRAARRAAKKAAALLDGGTEETKDEAKQEEAKL